MRGNTPNWAGLWRKSARADTPALYFLHIPKTAGTSVTAWLHKQLGDDAVCPAKNWDQMARIDATELRRYRAFAGHFGVDLEEFLGRKLLSASVFRNPLSRTRSHYAHVFRDAQHPRHVHVSRQSFQTFVEDESNWPMIENFQARYLLRTPIDFRGFTRRLDTLPSKRNRLSVLSEDARYLFDRVYAREKSLEALHRINVVGTTENLPVFLSALARKAGLAGMDDRADLPRENVAAPHDEQNGLDEHGAEILMALTSLDCELHAAASLRA